jgi:hypothetical protein
MENYFSGESVYKTHFNHLSRVVGAMNFSYEQGHVAHVDLVQEATQGGWTEYVNANSRDASYLRNYGAEYLKWLLNTLEAKTIFCDGDDASSSIRRIFKVPIQASAIFRYGNTNPV